MSKADESTSSNNQAQHAYRWPLWYLATIMLALQNFEILTVGAYAGDLGDSLHISSAQVGGLFGVYTFMYAAMQLPSGIAFSRYRATTLLAIACIVLAGGSILFAFSNNLYMAYTGRILSGIGGSFFFLGYITISANRFDPGQFATLLGANQLVKFLLLTTVLALMPTLLSHGVHWRQYFGMVGVIFLLFVPPLLLLGRRLPANATESTDTSLASIGRDLALIYKNPQMIRAMIIGFLGAGMIMAFAGLWYLPLAQSFGFSLQQSDHLDSIMMLFMGLGMAAAGWISDRLRRRKPVIIFGLCGSLAAMLAIIWIVEPPLWLETALVIVLAVSGASFFAILYVMGKESVPIHLCPTANGMLNTLIFGGVALGQYLPGRILAWAGAIDTQSVHTPVTDYQWAIFVYIPGILVALVLALKLRETAGVNPQ